MSKPTQVDAPNTPAVGRGGGLALTTERAIALVHGEPTGEPRGGVPSDPEALRRLLRPESG